MNSKPVNKSIKILKEKKLAQRDEIDSTYNWKTSHIYASDDEWEQEFRNLIPLVDKLKCCRGALSKSANSLLRCLDTYCQIEIILGKLSLYASLKNDEDTRTSKYQAMRDRIAMFSTQVNQKSAFINPEIISIPKKKITVWMKEKKELKIYNHYIDNLLRTKKHVLNRKEEQILALAGDISQNSYHVFTMFNNADLKFPNVRNEAGEWVELTKGNFSTFMKSSNRKIRRNVFNRFYSTYQEWQNTLAASIVGAVKRDIFYAKVRKYPSSLHSSLNVDNIPLKVYKNLISTINKNLEPLHQYITLRKNVLGLTKVKPWDLFVPLVKKVKWEVTYKAAVKIVMEACEPLGSDYLKILSEGFNSGWIDVYENKGKRSGAYSASVFDIKHPYILLNYNDQLDDVFTVAHEMGHALHSYLTNKNQPYIYSNYTIFVAEVASTLNEILLTQYLLKKEPDREKRLYLLNQNMDQIRGTVYIQTLFAEFEKIIHEKVESGQALTSAYLTEINDQLTRKFYGTDFLMDDLYAINWSRIPHFYYNFYVYQYATGYSAAIAIAKQILAGNKKSIQAYLNFLSSGDSEYSIDLLKQVGVDMTSPVPIEASAQLFNDLLNDMKILLG